jgi:hypothetical protein
MLKTQQGIHLGIPGPGRRHTGGCTSCRLIVWTERLVDWSLEITALGSKGNFGLVGIPTVMLIIMGGRRLVGWDTKSVFQGNLGSWLSLAFLMPTLVAENLDLVPMTFSLGAAMGGRVGIKGILLPEQLLMESS